MNQHPSSRGIGHIALRCVSLDVMRQFYCQTLGYRVVWQPDDDNVYLSNGHDNLALHAAVDLGSTEQGRLDHFGMLVDTAEEVDRWETHLRAAGVTVEGKARTHRDGSRSIYLRDPEGNRIQVIHLGPALGGASLV